ncbi:MAG: NUDIX hydrolase [Chitinivibrionales bacterium]
MTNLDDSPKIRAWKKAIEQSGCTIHDIEPLKVLHKRSGDVLFALLKADITAADGEKLLPYVFIRGDAVIVVTLVRNTDTGEERYLMVEQRRVANGHVALEFPAGMLDHLVDSPRQVAVRELEEETGVRITEDDLHDLTDRPLYSSPGASDEALYFYGCVIDMNSTRFDELEGRLAGDSSEQEHIRVTLKSREEALPVVSSVQVFLAFDLFNRFYNQSIREKSKGST